MKMMQNAIELRQLSNKLSLKQSETGQSQKKASRDNQSQNILDQLQFSHKIAQYGKRFITIFHKFLASIKKIFEEGWAQAYHSMKFRQFPHIS